MSWLLGFYMWLFIHRPFEYYSWLGSLQIERVVMFFIITCWLVVPNKSFPFNPMHIAVMMYAFAIFIAWQISPFGSEAACIDGIESIAKIGVFYILIVTCIHSDKDLKRLIGCFVIAVGLYMSHSLLEFFNGRYEWRMGVSRMIGVDATLNNPNAFAATLVFALPLTLPFWLLKPSRAAICLLVGFTAIAVSCVLLTGSRAGLVGLMALGLLVVFSLRKRMTIIVLLLFIALVTVVWLPDELQRRFLTLVDSSYGPANAQTSAEGRLDGFVFGLRLFQRSPLTGTGLNSFSQLTGREGAEHNMYGQVLGEMGLIGLLALFALLHAFRRNALTVRSIYRFHRLSPDFSYHVSQALSMSVLLLLLMGWSGHIMFRYNWLWFAAFQVVTVHCIKSRNNLVLPCAQVISRARRRVFLARRWQA